MQEKIIGVLWSATTWESFPLAFCIQIPQNESNASLAVQSLLWVLFYYLTAVGVFINRSISACRACFVITKMVITLWICSLNRCVGEGGEADARRRCARPGLDSRPAAEGGIGSSPAEFLTCCLFRRAGLHLLSTAPLNGSKLRVKYLLQLLPCLNHSSAVAFSVACVWVSSGFCSSSCRLRLVGAGSQWEQLAAWSSRSLQEGAVKSIFHWNESVSDTGCLGHLRNARYYWAEQNTC